MKEYKIIHTEKLIGWFYVYAESKEDALEIYHDAMNNGQIDFSDMELVDSEDTAELVEG